MFEPVTRLRPISGQVLYFMIWVAVTGFGAFLHPSPDGHGTHQELGLPPCPCALLLGRPCPGCGLTTSFTALIHGKIGESFRAHWMGPLLYALFTFTAFASLYGFLTRRRYNTNTQGFQRFLVVFTIAFIGYGIVRFAVVDHYRSATETVMATGLGR